MTKPFSEADFLDQIVQDRNWRIREISDVKATICKSDSISQRVLLRALVTICYAHWEGYVRFSSRRFLEHVALRKIPYRNLNLQFRKNYFIPRLGYSNLKAMGMAERCALIDEILSSAERRFSYVNDELINTRSNLNFEVFSDICLVCGIDVSHFFGYSSFINVILLKRRNSIAHGEETLIAFGDLDEIVNQTVELLRLFGDELENLVVMQAYRCA